MIGQRSAVLGGEIGVGIAISGRPEGDVIATTVEDFVHGFAVDGRCGLVAE
ncbi:hypothetical protein [Rhodococcus sp. ARC_M6]|uniref:hypothetical protein n=1 Tax=Rhodococcus sp. ARC_M6 TaxID=2928852 RepID=UPI001FB39075|nr:hypothetical protein [Rhodococcus sp. ARC_M6]MCJ0902768.1 hypothetical protein [Rhodococcus sp. ARC_M6]